MKFTKPGSQKVVTATNPKTVKTLEAAGWSRDQTDVKPETVKRKPGRPKK